VLGHRVATDGFIGGEEVFARPHAVETDEADDPLHPRALGVHGVVVETEHRSDFSKEFR
jgi:hypothetical protein